VHRLPAIVGTEDRRRFEDAQAEEVEVEQDVGVRIVARESFAVEEIERARTDHLEAAGRIADAQAGHQLEHALEEALAEAAEQRHRVRSGGERARADDEVGAILPYRYQQLADRVGRVLSVAVELDDDLDPFVERDLIPGPQRVAVAEVAEQ
jgi:hypothetical protein